MSDYPIAGYPDNLRAEKVTILSGAAVSEMIATQGQALVALLMPAAWTAAALQYYGCLSGSPADLKPVNDNNTGAANLMQTLVAASDLIVFPSSDAMFLPYLQLKSVTAASTTGVNQGGDRVIILLFRKYLN